MHNNNTKTVIALGNFDGVHIGHASLLEAAVSEAARISATPMVWTFERRIDSPPYLTSQSDKVELFRLAGISKIEFADFSALRDYSPERFVDEILIGKHNAAAVVCGFNFRFGAGGRGDSETLRALCAERRIGCVICPKVEYGGSAVSSTRIRELLAIGDLDRVSAMLGRDFSFEAPVVTGRKVGRSIGMPTMNQPLSGEMALPKIGVYAAYATTPGGQHHDCVTNIGLRPTFGVSDFLTCESHLLDFDGDLYDANVRLTLVEFLRPEVRFDSPEALVKQVQSDIESAREILKSHIKMELRWDSVPDPA